MNECFDAFDKLACVVFSDEPRTLEDAFKRAVIAADWHRNFGCAKEWRHPSEVEDFEERIVAELIYSVLCLQGGANV